MSKIFYVFSRRISPFWTILGTIRKIRIFFSLSGKIRKIRIFQKWSDSSRFDKIGHFPRYDIWFLFFSRPRKVLKKAGVLCKKMLCATAYKWVGIFASKDKIDNSQSILILNIPSKLITKLLVLYSAVCSQYQLFVYNIRCLFIISALCLQYQLLVYNISHLLTISAACLQYQLLVYNISCLFTLSTVCLEISICFQDSCLV